MFIFSVDSNLSFPTFCVSGPGDSGKTRGGSLSFSPCATKILESSHHPQVLSLVVQAIPVDMVHVQSISSYELTMHINHRAFPPLSSSGIESLAALRGVPRKLRHRF